MAFAEDRIGKVVDRDRVFVLSAANRRHIVIAGKAGVVESKMDVFESPFNLPPATPQIQK